MVQIFYSFCMNTYSMNTHTLIIHFSFGAPLTNAAARFLLLYNYAHFCE